MTIDGYGNPDAEALLRAGEERLVTSHRERRAFVTDSVGAASFILAASLLASLAPWQHPFSLTRVGLVLIVWIAVERVRFAVASGWTRPTMLAFVPMLFLLPTPIVPLIAMVAIVARRAAEIVRGRTSPALLAAFVSDAWFTIGPALVIVLGHAQRFEWSHWPIYVGALAAQVLCDLAASTTMPWFGERISPRTQLPLMGWVYAVDASLAPLGLIISSVAVRRPGLLLLTLPMIGVFELFARERQERLDAILELSTAYRGTTLLLCDMVEADDHYTGMHSRDVVDLSLAVADALGLDSTCRRNVEFSALLHDVGKVRVPKEIINKTGNLNDTEWEILRRHTIEGEAMLRQVGGKIASIGRIVRASHERWDGTGYPDGLIREQIPVEARIVAACDSYSAMTTDRPYREAMDADAAIAELRREAGRQFDPRVVGALECFIEAELLVGEDRPVREVGGPASNPSGQADLHQAGAILTGSRGCSSVG
jgi:HD-GYP domain-containing protein (c-di-GMP phosphodiesterase class II)